MQKLHPKLSPVVNAVVTAARTIVARIVAAMALSQLQPNNSFKPNPLRGSA
jgi:hypothetical protein